MSSVGGGVGRRVVWVLAAGSRWLNANLAWVVAWMVAVGAALAAVAVVADAVGDEGAVVSVALAQRVPVEQIPDLEVPAGASLHVDPHSGRATYQVASAVWWLRLLAAAGDLIVAVLIAVGAALAAGIARRFTAGRPFDPRVGRAMFWLALLFATGSILPAIVDELAATAVFRASGVFEVAPVSPVGLELHLGALVTAVLLAVLTQAFRHGQRLERDVEGLV